MTETLWVQSNDFRFLPVTRNIFFYIFFYFLLGIKDVRPEQVRCSTKTGVLLTTYFGLKNIFC